MSVQDGGVGRVAIVGQLELGIDMSNVDWPGELFIAAGPDPKILIGAELLFKLFLRGHREELDRRRAAAGESPWIDTMHPDVTLERPTEGHGSTGHGTDAGGCQILPGSVCHFGSILRIKTVEQALVYVIGEYELQSDAWWAQWPD